MQKNNGERGDRMRKIAGFSVVLSLALLTFTASAQTEKGSNPPPPLRDVKTVQVDPTIVANPDKMKEGSAPNLIRDSLISAFRSANIEVAESAPVRAHIVLNEFTSGSTAERFLVGFGAGRSTIDCLLTLTDADGKELKSVKLRVRGNLAFSPYQGNNTQRRQAVNSIDQRFLEEIEKMK